MTIEAILRAHFRRYPQMQIQDVYKLIHQAAMGSEHAVSNAGDAHQWMERETAELGEGPEEPVVDPISEDGEIVRVHLRPFLSQGGDPNALLEAFLRTANEYRGHPQILSTYWSIAAGMKRYPAAEMTDFIKSMQAQNFPAIHHSARYEHHYRPAYRVLWRRFLP